MCKFGSVALEWMPFNVLYLPKVHASLPKDFNTVAMLLHLTFLESNCPQKRNAIHPRSPSGFNRTHCVNE